MNYFNLVKNIQDTALKHQFVQEFFEGDVYDIMNTKDRKYPTVILTTERIDDTNGYQTITASLFCIDRLTSDGVNKLEVQSICQTILQGILLKLESAYPEMTIQTESFVPFTEKFKDLCAGMYVECSLSYPSMICDDEVFTTKEIILKSNGIYDVIGYDRAIVSVEIPTQSKELSISANGSYTILPDEGYYLSSANVNVSVPIPNIWKISNETKLAYSSWSSVPKELDFSNVTDFRNMFNNCQFLTSIPQLDTSKCTDFSNMFNYCIKLKTIPLIDTSKGTNFQYMFYFCNNLTSIPQLNTSKCTIFRNMFYNCQSLINVPQLDTSNGIYFNNMFGYCTKLTSIPQLNTSSSENCSYMFQYCRNLITIYQLNVSNCVSTQGLFSTFYQCTALKNITFVGSINTSVDFVNSKLLTYDSVKSILTACSNTTNTKAKTLKFSRTLTDQNNELTDLIATCTSKGWTISGLTLN